MNTVVFLSFLISNLFKILRRRFSSAKIFRQLEISSTSQNFRYFSQGTFKISWSGPWVASNLQSHSFIFFQFVGEIGQMFSSGKIFVG